MVMDFRIAGLILVDVYFEGVFYGFLFGRIRACFDAES